MKAHLGAYDQKWNKILKMIQEEGTKIIGDEKVKEILGKCEVREDEFEKAGQVLYVTLLSYTQGMHWTSAANVMTKMTTKV